MSIVTEIEPEAVTAAEHRSDIAGVFSHHDIEALSPAKRIGELSIACSGLILERRHITDTLALPVDADIATIIAHAYWRYGSDLARKLTGTFQFAVYDHQERILICAVSPFHYDALFYAQLNERLLLASKMPTLKALIGKPLKPNPRKLTELLVLEHHSQADSFYEGVSRLPGGHQLIFKDGCAQVSRFWEAAPVDLGCRTRQDFIEVGRDLLALVTNEMVDQTGLAASQLSGGLDSSVVSTMVANRLRDSGHRLACISSVPDPGFQFPQRPNWNLDDSALANAVADYNGNIDLHFLRQNQHLVRPFDMAKFCQEYSDGPVRNACNIGWGIASHQFAQAQGYQYLYSGSGGNMTFSWSGYATNFYRRARRAASFVKRSITSHFSKQTFWDEYCLVNTTALQAYHVQPPCFPTLSRLGHVPCLQLFQEAVTEAAGIMNAMASMSTVMQLDPTVDQRFIAFCLSVPNWVYHYRGTGRCFARGILEGLVPDQMRLNTRRGEQNPEWFYQLQQDLPKYKAYWQEYANNDLIRELIDFPGLTKTVEAFEACDPFSHKASFLQNEYRLKMARALHIAEWIRLHT